MIAGEYVFGRLLQDGSVEVVVPAIPIFDRIPDSWYRQYIAKSKLARTIKTRIKKHDKTKVSSATVEVTLVNKDGKRYENVPAVNVEFYRNGEENGKYVFQSMTSDKGKPIIFSYDESDVKVYDDAIILCIKDATDKFHFKIKD